MGNFQNLRVWQLAKELAVEIYKISKGNKEIDKDYRFKNQICAAAVSIVSNIAEGDELKTLKQSINHLYYAKGSTAELMTQIIIAKEIGYLDKELSIKLIDRCDHISRMLKKLILARDKT